MADGKVVIDIEADGSGFKSEIDGLDDEAKKAADGMDELGDGAKKAGEGMDAANVAMGTFIADGVTALISAVGDAVGSLVGLADATREYREDMAKLETAFSTAGHSTETARGAYEDFYAILGESDRSVEAVNHLAELTKSEEELAQWSTIAAGVTAKFGDSLPIEGLTEAANETVKVGEVTGPLADALNWAAKEGETFGVALKDNIPFTEKTEKELKGLTDAQRAEYEATKAQHDEIEAWNEAVTEAKSAEELFNLALSQCTTEQERAQLITDTLNGMYSDAAAEYNELTASAQDARRATTEMESAQADLGAAIEPVTTAWTRLKTNALQAILPVVQKVSAKIQELSKWMEENPEKANYLKGALIAVAAAVAVLVVAFGGLMIVNTLKTAFVGLGAAMGTAFLPVTLIIAGIAALVAGFIYLWNNCESFREFWIALWEKIKEIAQIVADWFNETWPLVVEWFKETWNSITEFFTGLWESVTELAGSASEWISQIWNAAVEWFKTTWNSIVEFFAGLWETVREAAAVAWDAITGVFSAAWEAIKLVWDLVSGYFSAIWETIKGIFAVVESVLSGNFSDAWEAIKRVIDTWSGYFSGVWTLIKGVFSSIGTWFGGKFQTAKKSVTDVWDTMTEYFTGIWDNIKDVFADAKAAGTKIVDDLKSGISDAWAGITTWFNTLWNNLFNRKASFSADANGATATPLATGMAYVPYDGFFAMLHKGERVLTAEENEAYAALLRGAVSSETGKATMALGRPDTGFSELAQAVGMQTAGINSLSSEYRRGGGANKRPIILQLDKRELGRAIVDVGSVENTRIGTKIVTGGAYA